MGLAKVGNRNGCARCDGCFYPTHMDTIAQLGNILPFFDSVNKAVSDVNNYQKSSYG